MRLFTRSLALHALDIHMSPRSPIAPRRRSRCVATGALVGCWGVLVACGGGVPLVPTGPHQDTSAPVIVEQPPPPAAVEHIPERPDGDCVWRDGYWEWDQVGYSWHPGAWVEPPPGCYFAPPVGAWAAGQTRVFGYRQAQWYPEGGKGTCPAPKLCGARQLIVE